MHLVKNKTHLFIPLFIILFHGMAANPQDFQSSGNLTVYDDIGVGAYSKLVFADLNNDGK